MASYLPTMPGSISNTTTPYESSATTIDESEIPNLARFMRVVENLDLARSNMFLVRLGDFRSIITNDGVLGFNQDIVPDSGNPNTGNPFDGSGYTWNRIQDIVLDAGYKLMTPEMKQMLGAYDPSLIRIFPGAGELLDGFLNAAYDVNKDMAMFVKAVNLPGTNFDTQINRTDRKPFTEVRSRTIDTITMTFYNTSNYTERNLMLAWMNSIHNNKRDQFSFYNSYAKAIDIITLDRKGVMKSIVSCDGCFPIRVGAVQLDYDSNNQVSTFEVEFAVSHMVHNPYDGKENTIDSIESIYKRVKGVAGAFS